MICISFIFYIGTLKCKAKHITVLITRMKRKIIFLFVLPSFHVIYGATDRKQCGIYFSLFLLCALLFFLCVK